MLTLFRKIEHIYPSTIIRDLILPVFIVTIITAVKIQYILCNEYEFIDTLFIHDIGDISPECHDIIFNGIIPLPHQFNNSEMHIILYEEHFQEECFGAKLIPLGMDVKIVEGLSIFKFTVNIAEKWGSSVFLGSVQMPPIIVWLYVLQNKI